MKPNVYPTDEELKDIDFIQRYYNGDLPEDEYKAVEERAKVDPEFADLFEFGECVFDPVESLRYEIEESEEIEKSRQNFQNFVDGLEDPLNSLEEIAERLPKRFKPTERKEYIFTSDRLEVLEIKEGVLRYWEDLRVPGVVCKFDLPITAKELLKLLV